MRSSPLILATLALSACGSEVEGNGVFATETRSVRSFDRVATESGIGIEVEIDSDSTNERIEIVVEADENLLPLLETEVLGSELVIRPAEPFAPEITPRVTMRVPALQGAALSGGSFGRARGIDGSRFDASLSGGSSLTLEGEASLLRAGLSGGSQLRAFDLVTGQTDLGASGASRAEVCVTDLLDVVASGSSVVRYDCGPDVVQPSLTGGSTVTPR